MNIQSAPSESGKPEPKPDEAEKKERKAWEPEDWVKVILGFFTTAGIIYGAYLVYLQNTEPIKIAIQTTQTAEAKATPNSINSIKPDNVGVSFSNPETNQASIRLIIRDADHPNDDPIVKIIIEPGGTMPINDLMPGKYQIEALPIYPAITPSSANCYIQWLPSDSYKADLVVTSIDTVFHIKQFNLEAQEVCFTETPVPPTPTPTQ